MSARDEAVEMIRRICPPHLSADEYGRILAEKFDTHRDEILAEAKVEVVAWLVKKAAEGTPIGDLASKADRGAIRIFLGTGHYQDAMDAHRVEILTQAIEDLNNCLRLGGIAQRGLILARKRLATLRDGDVPEPPRRNVRHFRIAERCREKPGEWLTVGTYSSTASATATARMIRGALTSRSSAATVYAPSGSYEARTAPDGDRTRVEARYVGTAAEAVDSRG